MVGARKDSKRTLIAWWSITVVAYCTGNEAKEERNGWGKQRVTKEENKLSTPSKLMRVVASSAAGTSAAASLPPYPSRCSLVHPHYDGFNARERGALFPSPPSPSPPTEKDPNVSKRRQDGFCGSNLSRCHYATTFPSRGLSLRLQQEA